jgi:hypothetical protein
MLMARNAVQFQKGLSEPAFDRQYGSEEQSRRGIRMNGYEVGAGS